ncbi:MAG TPA: ATP-binding cassette domain-containing protein [Candidatus Onthocola stercoravium]|nr:ATP-binding cassette domain-containing protein [Candidatus Onthocola stercoravium]
MLKVENITKKYGEIVAVNNLSFTVDAGEIFGLLGENGAGKTTTFRIIMGLIDANEGKVTLDGKKIDYSETDNIGFVTEERSLLTKLTVQEQIEFYGTLKGLDKDTIDKRLDYWLEKFEITSYKNRKIKELSKGNQQKIQFISAIINEPKLLILDEPFTGLDPINVKLMKDAIYYLKEKGCSIIFSSHQMEYIEDFCEKLILLVKGNTILDGKLDDIKENYAKKNIMIKGEDIDISAIKKLKGVISVEKTRGELEVKIANKEVAPKVFDIIKNSNITKYDVVSPSLNEIFIASVGGIHE